MDLTTLEAKILLANFFKRMKLVKADTAWKLDGIITEKEYRSLEMAVGALYWKDIKEKGEKR